MASSGWQGQRDIQTSKYPHMALNLNVWDIARSGTTLTFKAQVRVVVTSGSISYNNASVSVTGGGSTSINIQKSTGGYVDTGTFSCTITNVSTSTITYNVSASLSAGSAASGTATWTLDIGSGASAPTGLTATLISYTDTSAKIAIHIDSYGTPDDSSGRYIEAAVLGSSSYYDPYRYHLKYEAMDNIFDVTNDSPGGDLVITPNTNYHYGGYTTNTSMYVDLVAGSFTTLPAYITGVTTNYGANNSVALTVQHAAEGSALTVTTQYSWDGSTWINASDSFSLTVTEEKKIYFRRISNAGSTPVYETTLRANGGPYLYGSVSNLSKRLDPVYASFGNYFDGHHVLTGRESYVSTDISGDDITLTRVASGSGGYNWVAYPIDMTDELINKQVTISGEFKTSGSFTSGPRLWWLNSANTNILSGPVASIEYIGNSGKFSVSGAIPSRPSGAGKLALLLYSNIASAAQGAYTVYRNVELKANTKNMFNYTTVLASSGGLTNTLAADGTITTTGVPTANYAKIVPFTNITNLLEDGCWYTMRKDVDITNNVAYYEVRRKSTGGSYIYCATNGVRKSAAFKVDKTNFTEYGIYFQTNTTSVWGTSSRTITSRHQLEKGIDMSGENLINPFALGSGSTSGVNYSVASDGKITISGTASAACHVQIPFTLDSSLVGSSISIILDGKLDGFANFGLKNNTSDVSSLGTMNPAVPAVTTNAITSAMVSSVTCFDFYITNGSVVDASFYIKIKQGDIATSFAPFVDTKTHKLKKVYGSVDGRSKLIYSE